MFFKAGEQFVRLLLFFEDSSRGRFSVIHKAVDNNGLTG